MKKYSGHVSCFKTFRRLWNWLSLFFQSQSWLSRAEEKAKLQISKNDDLPKIAENDKPRNPICPQATNPGVKDLSSHLFFCFRWKRRKGEDCQNWDQSNFMLSLVTEKIIQQRHRKWRRNSKAMFPDNLVLSQHQLRNKYMKKRHLHISCNLSAWNKETRECLNQTGRHAKQSNPPTTRCKLASSYSLAWHMASFYSAVG